MIIFSKSLFLKMSVLFLNKIHIDIEKDRMNLRKYIKFYIFSGFYGIDSLFHKFNVEE